MKSKRLLPILAIVCCLVGVSSLWADVVYKQTMKMEGMGGMMQMEFQTTNFLKGEKQRTEMVSPQAEEIRAPGGAGQSITIMRLDKGIIWNIFPDMKTYMETSLKEMFVPELEEEKEKEEESESQAKVTPPRFEIKKTKESKVINGFKCQRVIMTMEAEGIDEKTGEKGSFSLTGDMWVAKGTKELKELEDFQKKLSEKTGGSSVGFIDKLLSGTQKGKMEEFTEKMNEIEGFPIVLDISMKAKGMFEDEEDEGEEEEIPTQMKGLMEAMKTGDQPIFTIHTEVTEIKSTSLQASQFELPQGFEKMSIK